MQKTMMGSRFNKVLMIGGSTVSKVLVESILGASSDFALVGAVNDVSDLVAAVDDWRPDVVLIDLCAPRADGGRVLAALRDFKTVRKVILSAEPLPEVIRLQLREAGAAAFFQKGVLAQDHDAFRRQLRAVLDGSSLEAVADSEPEQADEEGQPVANAVILSDRPARLTPVPGRSLDTHAVPSLAAIGPDNEVMRQTALAALGIANNDGDRRLDLVVKHLCQITGYPMAAVTLIDESVQWIKAGWGVARKPTPRAEAICDTTIKYSTPLIVTDTHEHPVFSTFGLVTGEPHIRSYVGVPLVVECGLAIGALCLMDTRPRTCVQPEIPILNDMAALIVEMLDKPWERMAA
jgi:DNA-binding NarL/FixJ family response regulator